MRQSRYESTRDYLAILVRQKWWVIIPFIAMTALFTLLASMMPRIYVSEAMIQTQQRDMPSDFVKDLVGGTNDQRLAAIEQVILSRTNLLRILSTYKDQLTSYARLNNDRKVDKLKNRIRIDLLSERVGGRNMPVANIRIACSDQNPNTAQRITEHLTQLFMEQESRSRENLVGGATEFLAAELKKVAEALEASNTRLKQLKEKYRYELPEQLDTNLRTLDRLQLQKTGNLEALDRHMAMQMNLEKQLSETPAMIPRSAAIMSGRGTVPPEDPLVTQYKKKEQEYNELLSKATEKHPEVARLKRELEQLKKDLPDPTEKAKADEPAGEKPKQEQDMVPNPMYQTLQAQILATKTEIDIRQREKKYIENEMARTNQRVQNTPRTEQEVLAELRSNADLTKQHEDLRIKLTQAQLAESLESRNKGAQFLLLDAANRPTEPASPSKMTFALIGTILSLAISLGLAFAIGWFDTRIWTQSEMERYLGTAVLVEIPKISRPDDRKRAFRWRFVFASLVLLGFGLYSLCLYYIYLNQPTVVKVLDPIIEKILSRYA